MNDKDRIELIFKRAEIPWRNYSERRSIEWKVNFALWAGLGSFSGFIFQYDKPLPFMSVIIASFLLSFAFLVYTFMWKKEIQLRNRKDAEDEKYFLGLVDDGLRISTSISNADNRLPNLTPSDVAEKEQSFYFWRWRSTHLSQVCITSIFILLGIASLWTKI